MKNQAFVLNKRMFTLIELLVVISIISVLSGMMMPALGKTRQTARGISCASNLKQIGLYIEQYQASNDGWLAGASGGWCCNTGTWMCKNINQQRCDLRTQGIVVDINDPLVKGCPEVIEKATALMGPANEDGSVTAASTGTCHGAGLAMNMNLGLRMAGRVASRTKASQVARPSFAVAVSDTEEELSTGAGWYYYLQPRKNVTAAYNGGSYEWDPNQAFRHNGQANVSWLDGHVSSERPGEFGSTGFCLANNIGWLGTNDAPYLITRADYAEAGISLDGQPQSGE